MNAIITIVPLFLLILLGYLLQKKQFPGNLFWPAAARITYFIFFPALVLRRLAIAQMDLYIFGQYFLTIGLAIILTASLLFLTKKIYQTDGPGFSSLVQGSIRFNTYLGLALALSLWGNAGLEMAALLIALLIPIVNIICVFTLALHGSKQITQARQIIKEIAFNPLIAAAFLGIFFNFLHWPLPKIADELLNILGQPALPLGLMTVGAGLQWTDIRSAGKIIVWSVFWKMLLLPSSVLALSWYFSIEPAIAGTAFIFAILPTASSAYILAQEMGGNTRSMAAILTMQTLIATVTIPIALILWDILNN